MLIIAVIYYIIVIITLLITYVYIALKKKDIILIILLFASTMPILALIFVGGAEQRVVYWPFLSTLTLSFYVFFNTYDLKTANAKLIIFLAALSGLYTWYYHFDYVIDNIAIVKERQTILENIPNTQGDIILPRVRATVHGSVGEDTWDYWVMREYYGIQDRKVITEPSGKDK